MKFEQVTVILNRGCPRDCPQCGIADNSREAMSVEDWIRALSILRDEFGAWFYLFLGTEPLLFREGLIDLIKWFHKEKLYYGFYSTSPEPLFSRYRQQLVDAGLQNWSSGIDGLPGMDMDPITDKKARESIAGLQWMAERGVQTHTLTTIHKKNLLQVPETLRWLQKNIPGVQSSANFIEWRREPEMDFFSPKADMADLCWDGTPEEAQAVRSTMAEIKLLSRVQGMIIQTVDQYLDDAVHHYNDLNLHCEGHIGPAIDADGTLRLCGYSTGRKSQKWSVFDLPGNRHRFMEDWMVDLNRCSGCHWHYVEMIRIQPRILNPQSGIHQERWCLTEAQYEQLRGRAESFDFGPSERRRRLLPASASGSAVQQKRDRTELPIWPGA